MMTKKKKLFLIMRARGFFVFASYINILVAGSFFFFDVLFNLSLTQHVIQSLIAPLRQNRSIKVNKSQTDFFLFRPEDANEVLQIDNSIINIILRTVYLWMRHVWYGFCPSVFHPLPESFRVQHTHGVCSREGVQLYEVCTLNK